jgi:psiF repeat-containing protein
MNPAINPAISAGGLGSTTEEGSRDDEPVIVCGTSRGGLNMSIRMLFAALGTIALLSAGVAHAEPAATPPTAKAAPRSPKSIECSKQADAKGLHGKERRKFRRQCLRGKS